MAKDESEFTDRQREARRHLRDMIDNFIRFHDINRLDDGFLRTLLTSLDNFFFAGMLADYVTIRGMRRDGEMIGLGDTLPTEPQRPDAERISCGIRINLLPIVNNPKWASMQGRVVCCEALGTILHELCHCFVLIFTSQCLSCERMLGHTCHGVTWQRVAFAAHDMFYRWLWPQPPAVPGIRFDIVGICTSMIHEIRELVENKFLPFPHSSGEQEGEQPFIIGGLQLPSMGDVVVVLNPDDYPVDSTRRYGERQLPPRPVEMVCQTERGSLIRHT